MIAGGLLLAAVTAGTWVLSAGIDHVYRCCAEPTDSATADSSGRS